MPPHSISHSIPSKMKLPLLVLSFLFFPFILLQPSTASSPTVLDTSGQPLRRDTSYYILPLIRGRGGGLTLAPRNISCPLYVAQEASEVDDGLPLRFSPVNPSDKVVRLSTDFNVEFDASTICVQSTVWKLGGLDNVTGQRYVVTPGVKGNPGPATLSNWFRVERYGNESNGNGYKLVFCPGVCNFCKVLCGDVGVFNEGGKRWLGFNGLPFPLIFKREINTLNERE